MSIWYRRGFTPPSWESWSTTSSMVDALVNAVQVVADGPEVVDALHLGDDVELATLVELQGHVADRLEARPELGLGLAHALGHRPHLAVTPGAQHHDPVGLAQPVGAQHDPLVAVEH